MPLDHTGRIVVLAMASAVALTTSMALAHGPKDADGAADGDHEEHEASAEVPAAEAADRLLARLRYVREDYPRAVVDGRIVDSDEYEEQGETLEEALALTVSLPLSTGTRTALGAVDAAVERRAPAAEVVSACDALLGRLGEELWLELDPPDPARLAEGATLYGAHCAACHGTRGQGPGPELVLRPAPAAFREAAVAARLSPRRVYEAVTFGVEGTAMVGRADTLTEPERWALGFYVAGLATRPASSGAGDQIPALTLEELAETTNAGLAGEAPTGVAPGAAVAEWRGPEVAAAAMSPWRAMREDAREAVVRSDDGAAALDRLRARWKKARKPVAKLDPLLAMQVDTAIAAMGPARHREDRAREAAQTVRRSLAEVEKRMR